MSRYPKNYLPIEQRTAQWFQARCGLVTASRIADVLAITKSGKPSEKRERYKMEMLTEILTGECVEHFVSPAMDFGIQNEPLARTAYEMVQEVEVERIGFVLHPRLPRSGASPDGLVGPDGLVEIKVPNTTTHLGYVLEGKVPEQYRPQMLWQLACCERQWCDFVSYDPRLPEDFGLFIVRLERDEVAIAEMEKQVESFIAEVNAMAETLQKRAKDFLTREKSGRAAGRMVETPNRDPQPKPEQPPRSEMPDIAEWFQPR